MQLICPNCREQIPSDNINIQELVAVCVHCDTVFKFDVPTPKVKRRKIYQPEKLTVTQGENLQLSYHTNFRLGKNENFLAALGGSIFLTVVTLLLQMRSVPAILLFSFGMMALLFYYWLALIVMNKTHIEMSGHSIKVSRQPLPAIFNISREMDLSDVESISAEETPESIKHSYDTPRFNVWANKLGGSRRVIVSDVTESYGLYIAQCMNDHLMSYEEYAVDTSDTSRLEDKPIVSQQPLDDLSESQTANQNHDSQ